VDPELAWVVRWRETGEERTEGDLFIGNSRSKYYWANSEDFVLEKGILWRKGERECQQGGLSQRSSGNKS
jgi:hypothetical protein